MICQQCFATVPDGASFCASCGLQAQVQPSLAEKLDNAGEAEAATPSRQESYLSVSFSLLCWAVCAASLIFTLSSGLAIGNPAAFPAMSGTSVVGLIFTSMWASKAWRHLKAVKSTVTLSDTKYRNFVLGSQLWIGVFLVGAAVGGTITGTAAKRKADFSRLFKRMSEVGVQAAPIKQKFISLNTLETPTMDDYVSRCARLEVVNNQYRAVLTDMNSIFEELRPRLADDPEMAENLKTMSTLQDIVAKDLEGTNLVVREVQLARQLSALPREEQVPFYKREIQPVRDSEEKNANDEIAVLITARSNGVKLPEKMYTDLGIK